jgi:hypothetical protein
MEMLRVITKRLLDHKEAAEYLGISSRQLADLVAAREIIQTRLPRTRKRLYDVMELDRCLSELNHKKS